MSGKVIIGNDELIHYFRKNYPASKARNPDLGKKLWKFMKVELGAEKAVILKKLKWDKGKHTTVMKLPKSAHQFVLNKDGLPRLYEFLDQLGSGSVAGSLKRK